MHAFKITMAALLLIALGALAKAQLSQTGMGVVAGGGAPPSSCTGTIDLSEGCTLPMMGGL